MASRVQLSRKTATKNPHIRWDAINEFCAFANLNALTPVQKVAYLAYRYSTKVEIGGHHEFFSAFVPTDLEETAAALRTIGAIEQESILVAAYRAVTAAEGCVPEQYTNRYRAGVEFSDFVQFDDAFHRCRSPVAAHLMNYLDSHENEFIDWQP